MDGNLYASHLDWYRKGRLAPYMTAYKIATHGVTLLEALQPATDTSDPATDSLTIAYVKGATRFRADMGAGPFRSRGLPGEMVLIAPDIATDSYVEDPHCVRFLSIDRQTVRHALDGVRAQRGAFDFGRLHSETFIDGTIRALIDKLWREAEEGDPVSQLQADGTVLLIVAALLRLAETPARVHRGGLAPWQVRRATEMIAANLAGDAPLAGLASEVGLSPFHFARAFKVSTGLPPHAWQMARRIERAKELLETGDRTVTEIALDVGYQSSQALARLFQNKVGVTPSAWRRERRG